MGRRNKHEWNKLSIDIAWQNNTYFPKPNDMPYLYTYMSINVLVMMIQIYGIWTSNGLDVTVCNIYIYALVTVATHSLNHMGKWCNRNFEIQYPTVADS